VEDNYYERFGKPMIEARETLTQRELMEYEQHKEMFRLEAEFRMSEKEKEIELARLEAKWASWLKIPLVLIKLPVYLILALAYCIAVARKAEVPEDFWKLLK
jgi:hypothetical protein